MKMNAILLKTKILRNAISVKPKFLHRKIQT
jgi:hypothetical protein